MVYLLDLLYLYMYIIPFWQVQYTSHIRFHPGSNLTSKICLLYLPACIPYSGGNYNMASTIYLGDLYSLPPDIQKPDTEKSVGVEGNNCSNLDQGYNKFLPNFICLGCVILLGKNFCLHFFFFFYSCRTQHQTKQGTVITSNALVLQKKIKISVTFYQTHWKEVDWKHAIIIYSCKVNKTNQKLKS